jgi:hypothetical protein
MKVVYFQLKINEISIAVSPTFDHFYAVVGALNFRKIWGQKSGDSSPIYLIFYFPLLFLVFQVFFSSKFSRLVVRVYQ